MTHNWEMVLEFAVHGSGKNLFGDGFAMWYTKEKNIAGMRICKVNDNTLPVFLPIRTSFR